MYVCVCVGGGGEDVCCSIGHSEPIVLGVLIGAVLSLVSEWKQNLEAQPYPEMKS